MTTKAPTEAKILLDRRTHRWPCYLELLDDGTWLAGLTRPRPFATAREVFDWYHTPAINGNHGAWNICAFVSDYISGIGEST